MRRIPLSNPNASAHPFRTFFRDEGPALLALSLSLAVCFKDWFSSRFFLSLDTTAFYYPLTLLVHDHLLQGRLPFISDLFYNGAPLSASIAGLLSPVIWLVHGLGSGPFLLNILFVLPFAFYLFGAYFLGRELTLTPAASVLLALLWTYNGHQMAQLDHQNIAWAHSFFPWAFLCLLRFQAQNRPFWLLSAAFMWGLCLLSGHPQVVLMEGLFFLGWALFYPHSTLGRRIGSCLGMTLGTLLVTAPATLFTANFLPGEKWSAVDRFFHSWTPVNFITLLFPWCFGKDQYDRVGSDYWWQYQFVEMQVALSIVGLFFVLLFFFSKRTERRWIIVTALFGLAMALGKFFFVYSPIQSLPLFSFFRDPARYWFLMTWVLGIGAAFAWDDWFDRETLIQSGRKLSLGLLAAALSLVVLGWVLLNHGQTLVQNAASWFIRHYLLGDSLHTQSLSAYLDRLPSKIAAIGMNLNLLSPRVFVPILFLITLVLLVFNRKRWNIPFQKSLLIGLMFIDLMAFRMPLGNSFYSDADVPGPQIPAAQSRSLPLISQSNSPLPPQYGQYAFPDVNLISRSPVLPFYTSPDLGRYNTLLADLGWFAWVYRDRDLTGFTHHPRLLSVLGVDQIVSDTPFKLPRTFKTLQDHPPYVYRSPGVLPKALVVSQYQIIPWPQSINTLELPSFDPNRMALLESQPDFASSQTSASCPPEIHQWDETHLSLTAQTSESSLLILQKTFLPGWHATVNGSAVQPLLCDLVLTAIPLKTGVNQVELTYSPLSLRLGFFLFFIFLGIFILSFFSFLLA